MAGCIATIAGNLVNLSTVDEAKFQPHPFFLLHCRFCSATRPSGYCTPSRRRRRQRWWAMTEPSSSVLESHWQVDQTNHANLLRSSLILSFRDFDRLAYIMSVVSKPEARGRRKESFLFFFFFARGLRSSFHSCTKTKKPPYDVLTCVTV